jgi:mRNA interferase HigB
MAFLAIVPFWGYAPAVRVIAVATLRAFWQRHPDAEQPLKAWFEEATKASWMQPSDIKAHYRSASVLENRRVVFNIKGNEYRLIVAIAYRLQIVYVKFIGTHTEHDDVDADNVGPD